MKKNLLLAVLLLLSVMCYSQAYKQSRSPFVSTIKTTHINPLYFNTFHIATVPFRHINTTISKSNNRLEHGSTKKRITFYKILPVTFIKRLKKTKKTDVIYTTKSKKSPKGFHIVDGLFDDISTTPKLLPKNAFDNSAMALKVLYGYQFAIKKSAYITSYPGLAIATLRAPEKQSIIGNLTKDVIPGIKLIIDLNI